MVYFLLFISLGPGNFYFVALLFPINNSKCLWSGKGEGKGFMTRLNVVCINSTYILLARIKANGSI